MTNRAPADAYLGATGIRHKSSAHQASDEHPAEMAGSEGKNKVRMTWVEG